MARTQATASQLESLVSRLQAERQEHLSAVAEIDAVFEQFGLKPPEAKRRGRRPGRPRGSRNRVATAPAAPKRGRGGRRRGGRRSFDRSGPESILEFVKSRGAKGATTSEVNRHWKDEGRAGDAYVTLGQLVKQRQLKRENLKGERGSRYVAA